MLDSLYSKCSPMSRFYGWYRWHRDSIRGSIMMIMLSIGLVAWCYAALSSTDTPVAHALGFLVPLHFVMLWKWEIANDPDGVMGFAIISGIFWVIVI